MSVEFIDNSKLVIETKDHAIRRALEAVGVHIEGEAKDELENSPRRVDTGRLKGSITYATAQNHSAGQEPSTPSDYKTKNKPEEETVYIGTNVEYAAYVHEGTQRMKPNRFLKKAVQRNASQIREYFKRELEGKY